MPDEQLCDMAYACDCGKMTEFAGPDAPSRCPRCGRDVDTRKIRKLQKTAGLAPVPSGSLFPTYGVEAGKGDT